MSGEQLDNLALQADALGGTASDGTGSTVPPGAVPPEQQAPQNAGVIAVGLTMFRELGTRLGFASLAETLNDKAIETIAEQGATVCDKYGLDLSKTFAGFEVEAKAIMVAGPLVWAVAVGIWRDNRAMKAKPVDGEEVRPEAPSGGG